MSLHYKIVGPIIGIFGLLLIIGLFFYQKHEEETMIFPDWKEIKQSDTLKVGMIYNSHSYFILKDQEMGYDYELIKKFADKHNFTLQIHIAQSETELLRLLTYNTIDLIAYPIMMTLDRKQKIRFLENEQINNQVLVQRKGRGELTSPTELIGQSIVVPKNSKYEKRLIHLNEELGGGIYIQTVDDTTAIETLIRQVAQRDIDYTIADNNIALLNKTYYRNIDCKTAISFSQRSAWAVNNSTPILADSINQWIRQQKNFSDNLYNKYFVKAKYFNSKTVRIPRGAISPYDDLFKQYAPTIPWDWQLMAAVGFEESRFDTAVISWVGARGIMQMMPNTAESYGLTEDDLTNPENSISSATQHLKKLNHLFRKIENNEERIKFILASYNAGHGHILDAMALAEKYGKNPHLWYGNVEEFLILKRQKEYYQDPVVKCGYFRAGQTVAYVSNVLKRYEKYMGHNP